MRIQAIVYTSEPPVWGGVGGRQHFNGSQTQKQVKQTSVRNHTGIAELDLE